MRYLVRTPWWLKKIYRDLVWEMPPEGNKVYLSFDDGPHPEATPFVLDMLKAYGAKASFFCIGKNVGDHPGIFLRTVEEGHTVANHSFDHCNGWETDDAYYFESISKASQLIPSMLFRPPYGRIRFRQIQHLRQTMGMTVIMWTVLSGDFDNEIDGVRCAENVISKMKPGSIIVFHDSQKALAKLRYALPLVLEELRKRGWIAEKL
jgi:peptidoglycan/xylan/chitin deacetylase (PgdA/CDA1 family)